METNHGSDGKRHSVRQTKLVALVARANKNRVRRVTAFRSFRPTSWSEDTLSAQTQRTKKAGTRPALSKSIRRCRLATSLLHLRAALANLELGVALANHVHATTTLHDLTVGMPVLECSDAADDFHDSVPDDA